MRSNTPNIIVELTFEFALEIIRYSQMLKENKHYILADQLLRSGTSIGANVREAQNAESRADFIHKMKLAAKEASETEYWLDLCHFSGLGNNELLKERAISISKVLSKIISSTRSNT